VDASNLLKPQLARGELACVGATTTSEYRLIEKDVALARRFQPITVPEPSVAQSITILRGLKERYQAHHGIQITDAALVAAVTHAHRYVAERKLPDKAIDLIDEAAARVRMVQESKPEGVSDLEREVLGMQMELAALKKEGGGQAKARTVQLQGTLHAAQAEAARANAAWAKQRAAQEQHKTARQRLQQARAEVAGAQRDGNMARAGELTHAVIPRLESELLQWEEQTAAAASGAGAAAEQVGAEQIAEVVARATGIPVSSLMAGERDKLLHMEARLAEQVVGQDEALRVVSDAVRVSRAGLQAAERPLGAFLLVGPTGVGKTQLTKALAQFLFDSPDAVTRFDMSEYSERHSVARLVGAPPGYVGYDEGGQLTEAVRRRPYSLLLLDEFEKAHRDVATLLLQVLDEGHLTDSHGKRVDFRNTLVVLTSNLGAEALAALPEGAQSEQARPEVLKAVAEHLPPEFVNRLDQIVLFNRLQRAQIAQIVGMEVDHVRERLRARGLRLGVSPGALSWLAGVGHACMDDGSCRLGSCHSLPPRPPGPLHVLRGSPPVAQAPVAACSAAVSLCERRSCCASQLPGTSLPTARGRCGAPCASTCSTRWRRNCSAFRTAWRARASSSTRSTARCASACSARTRRSAPTRAATAGASRRQRKSSAMRLRPSCATRALGRDPHDGSPDLYSGQFLRTFLLFLVIRIAGGFAGLCIHSALKNA
jgi:ATP-dependent Clp protease ATP-binding subunit ClpB